MLFLQERLVMSTIFSDEMTISTGFKRKYQLLSSMVMSLLDNFLLNCSK